MDFTGDAMMEEMKKCCNVKCDEETGNDYFDFERKITLCDKCLQKLSDLEPFPIDHLIDKDNGK